MDPEATETDGGGDPAAAPRNVRGPLTVQDFLTHMAHAGAAAIHPMGRTATEILLRQLPLTPRSRVLELGCGTGETSLRMACENDITSIAVDRSLVMLATAARRFRFLGLPGRTSLIQANTALPFRDGLFDGALCESVLAINSRRSIVATLAELHRVLTPGAALVANEAVWRPGTPRSTVDAINSSCLRDFGLIQSTADLPDVSSWRDALTDAGFEVVSANLLEDELVEVPEGRPASSSLLRASRRFTLASKIRALMRPTYVIEHLRFRKALHRHRQVGRHIEARLFVAIRGRQPESAG